MGHGMVHGIEHGMAWNMTSMAWNMACMAWCKAWGMAWSMACSINGLAHDLNIYGATWQGHGMTNRMGYGIAWKRCASNACLNMFMVFKLKIKYCHKDILPAYIQTYDEWMAYHSWRKNKTKYCQQTSHQTWNTKTIGCNWGKIEIAQQLSNWTSKYKLIIDHTWLGNMQSDDLKFQIKNHKLFSLTSATLWL